MIRSVLIYLEKNNQYLMLFRNKKKGDLNNGKWLGVGGKIKENETKEEALIREVKEETNLNLHSFRYIGEITFIDDEYSEIMYLFHSLDFEGELKQNEEGTLEYIDIPKIYSLNLWDGDKYFLPYLKKDLNSELKMTLEYKNHQLINVKINI